MLEAAGHHLSINPIHNKPITPQSLIRYCRENDALIVSGFAKLDERFFSKCRHLKAVALFSVGYDNVDLEAATHYGIPVSNTPNVLSKATAETAFLLMLAVSRKAFYNYSKILNGEWKQFEPVADLGQAIFGKTLGIFGMGKIGYAMAKLCREAFQMKIIYFSRSRKPKAEEALEARFVSFHELLEQSDVLSVHANLSSQTTGLFNRENFLRMKPHAIFINTARGAMHDENDLIWALKKKVIWGAGLDVTNPEPMHSDNPLLKMPSVCVLPHIGSATRETRDAMASLVAVNLIAASKGERMPTVVNPKVYD